MQTHPRLSTTSSTLKSGTCRVLGSMFSTTITSHSNGWLGAPVLMIRKHHYTKDSKEIFWALALSIMNKLTVVALDLPSWFMLSLYIKRCILIYLSFIVVNIRKQDQLPNYVYKLLVVSVSHVCYVLWYMMSLHKLIFSTFLLIFRSFLVW